VLPHAAEAIAVADTVAVYTDEPVRRPTVRTEGLAVDVAGHAAMECAAPTSNTVRAIKAATVIAHRIGIERKMKRRRLS
jgi:hypothetical protein